MSENKWSLWEGKTPDGEVVRIAAVLGPLVRLLAGLQSGDIDVAAEDDPWIDVALDTLNNIYVNLEVDELEREEDFVNDDGSPKPAPHIMDVYMTDGKTKKDREWYIAMLTAIIVRLNGLIEARGWEVIRRGNGGLDWAMKPMFVTERG